MKILALDTSSEISSIALVDNEKLIGEFNIKAGRKHSKILMPMISNLFSNTEYQLEDIDFFAVSSGPGSFTGLRISAVVAKTFAQTTGKKIVDVPTLDALAYNMINHNGFICSMIDAKRERVYASIYKVENKNVEKIEEYKLIEVDTLKESLDQYENIVLLGNGVKVNKEKLEKYNKANEYQIESNAKSVAKRAYELIRENKTVEYDKFKPKYFKKTQAENNLKGDIK